MQKPHMSEHICLGGAMLHHIFLMKHTQGGDIYRVHVVVVVVGGGAFHTHPFIPEQRK